MQHNSTNVDRETSDRIARWIDSIPKACWHNACTALIALDNPLVVYVEGWVVDESLPWIVIEHGWLMHMHDGMIYDPTLIHWHHASKPHYFPGVVYPLELVTMHAARDYAPPFVCNDGHYGRHGLKHDGYKAAWEAANQYLLPLMEAAKRQHGG